MSLGFKNLHLSPRGGGGTAIYELFITLVVNIRNEKVTGHAVRCVI